MGSAVAAAAAMSGARVVWASDGRSAATRARAEVDRLEDVGTVSNLASVAEVIISVCPPGDALAVAEQVAATGFSGAYLDANAIAPATARRVAACLGATVRFVDGGIIGSPPRRAGSTRLYLAGEAAALVAACFDGSPLEVVDLEAPVGSASALKMAYGGWTKGTTALLAAVEALALGEGVHDALYAEWRRSQPDLIERSGQSGSAAAKGWRWVSEMEEIAAAFEAVGLPTGFHEGAAEVYRRLEQFKDDPDAPGGPDLAAQLLRPPTN